MARSRPNELLPPVVHLTPEESWLQFESDCRRVLGISADEFIARYRAGELVDDDEPENWKIASLAMTAALFL
jgi:hypothetical protein